jgi:acyl-CoA hydrolase
MTSTANGRPVRDSRCESSALMMPQDENVRGHVFGGAILAMLDKTAAVCAMRHARMPCVTASVDRVDFREPIMVGELIIMKASVNWVGKTSMEVGVRVEAENLLTGKRRHTNSCYTTFVALDEVGKPTAVPPLVLESDDERRRHDAAAARRQRRLQERDAEQLDRASRAQKKHD